jgi:hypothetical protein
MHSPSWKVMAKPQVTNFTTNPEQGEKPLPEDQI